jgi:membrane protein
MESAGLAALGKFFGGLLRLPAFVLHSIDLAISLGATTVLFALILRYVPATRVA